MDRGIGGAVGPASAFFCKHPPKQYREEEALVKLEAFISGKDESLPDRWPRASN
jgi:myo-inositol-1-phosphate synthase